MITVTNLNKSLTIKGHANSDVKGHDIVCAGVSSLVCTTINALEGFNKSEISYKNDELVINIKHKVSKEDKTRLDMLILGLRLISKKYSKHIKIKEKKI